jgi:cytochrome oxidase Cu insertion factor (SCO1/SenC/PrrC family)
MNSENRLVPVSSPALPLRRPGRRRLGIAATVVMALAVLAACGGGSSGSSRIPVPSQRIGTSVDIALPANIAHIPLVSASGKHTTLAAFRGEPVMIADFMTLCSDVCPLISANVAAMARSLAKDGYAGKVALLEISIDPARDSPARLRAYQKLYGGSLPGWTLLTPSKAGNATLWKSLGVGIERIKEPKPADIDWLTHKPLTYDLAHTDDVVFLDARGHERFVIDGSPQVDGSLPPTLLHFLTKQGVRNLQHPQPVADWSVPEGMQVLSWLTNRKLAPAT